MAKNIIKGAAKGAAGLGLAGLYAGNRIAASTEAGWAKNMVSTGRVTNDDGSVSIGKAVDALHPYVNEAALHATVAAQHVGGAVTGAILGAGLGAYVAHRRNRNLGRQFK
jgi:hypothetical protein